MMEENTATNSLSKLNIDCLLKICKYLPISDKINFMEAYTYLQNCKDLIFSEYKSVDVNDWYRAKEIPKNSNAENFKNVCEVLQNYVHSIHVYGEVEDDQADVYLDKNLSTVCPGIFHLIYTNKYFHNLQYLYIHSVNFKTAELQEFKNLKTLSMVNSVISPNFFSKITNITEIKLLITKIGPNSLSLLKNLKAIDIFYADCFRLEELTQCLKNNPKLTSFLFIPESTFCSSINMLAEFMATIPSLTSLTYLDIRVLQHYPQSEQIFQSIQLETLKSLKFLTFAMDNVPKSVNCVLEKNQLELLDISECNKCNNLDLKRLLLNCVNLKYLRLNPEWFDAEYLSTLKTTLNLISFETLSINNDDYRVEFKILNEHLQYFDTPSIAKVFIDKLNSYTWKMQRQLNLFFLSPNILHSYKTIKKRRSLRKEN